MKDGLVALVEHGVNHWMSSRGVFLVLGATLLPLVLTGAWRVTHDADLAAEDLSWTPETLVEGDNATFTATIRNTGGEPVESANVTLAVGEVSGRRLVPSASKTTEIGFLSRGETATVTLDWTAQPGAFYALLDVDPNDEISEIQERNNRIPEPLIVRYADPPASQAPDPPANLTGNASANRTADLAVTDVNWSPREPKAGENVTVTATFAHQGGDPVPNATLVLRLMQTFGGSGYPVQTVERTVNLTAGETRSLNLTWQATPGVRWVQAYAEVPESHHDPDGANQNRTADLVAQPVAPKEPPEPPERVTLKKFYLDVLNLLHLRFLLPLVALFYAGGVIADDRRKGNLPYLVTPPIPRWSLPVTRFAAGYLVAALATVLGIAGTYLIIFGTPVGSVGYLVTPLLISLLTLLVYGALFMALGVMVDRPYLVGALFVLGWETAAGLFVPWVRKLTLHHWITEAVKTWPLEEGLVWLPRKPMALGVLLAVSAAAIVLAAVWAERREYPNA